MTTFEKMKALVCESIERDPAKWQPWLPLPSNFIDSPNSIFYQDNEDIVNLEINTIIDKIHNTKELEITRSSDEEKIDSELIISTYYWDTINFIIALRYLKNFGRLDF